MCTVIVQDVYSFINLIHKPNRYTLPYFTFMVAKGGMERVLHLKSMVCATCAKGVCCHSLLITFMVAKGGMEEYGVCYISN